MSVLLCPSYLRAAESARFFAIPAGEARSTLTQFIEQSAEQIVYSPQIIRGVRTHAVQGRFEPSVALRQMLAGTSLIVLHDESTGALSLARE
ncbi:MAG: STN domain-containing protein, partial [Opitutaceae bacterium]|nr:STN domain-containing protein [Opitutaceae bacterium]